MDSAGERDETVSHPADWEEVRLQIRALVLSEAAGMVRAAVDKAKDGHYFMMKYAFELAGLHPPLANKPEARESSLVRALCEHLGLPVGDRHGDMEKSAVGAAPDGNSPRGNGHALK